jgi:hypothetical protein
MDVEQRAGLGNQNGIVQGIMKHKKLRDLWAVFVCLLAFSATAIATTRPIGPEESPVADVLTINDWVDDCTADSSSDCGTNAAYGTPAAGDEGKLRFLCEPSHLLYDDPIVYPGQVGAAHLHHFFGNASANANSTYATLRASGDGTCQGGPLNRTAYWFPAMIKTDTQKVVKPDFIELYYNVNRHTLWDESGSGGYISSSCVSKGGDGTLNGGPATACPMYATSPIERGMKAIFGNLAATGESAYGGQVVNWSCTGGANKEVLWDASTPSNGVQACPAGTTVQVRLVAPECWNGNYDHADHYSHLAYGQQDGYGFIVCPATHPYRIPEITIIIAWSHEGESDYSTWKLSSDIFNGANFRTGETFHTDAFWAWNDATQEAWHTEINGMHTTPGVTPYTGNASGRTGVGTTHVRESVNGGLGNGTQMINNGVDSTATPSGSRYLDIPASTAKRGRKGKMR